jgi:hypothetical protein
VHRTLATAIVVTVIGFCPVMAQLKLEPPIASGDRVEIGLVLKQTGPLQLAVTGSCPASVTPAQFIGPGRVVLSIIPKGFSACLVTLAVSDAAGTQTAYRLEIASPGEGGFSVIVTGNGAFDPAGAPSLSGDAGLRIVGGWGDLHLDGEATLASDGTYDGRVDARYQGFRALLANSFGAPLHPAGDAGRGLYLSQDLPLGFTLAWARPFSAPMRFGLGFSTPYVCVGGSLDILAQDPIFSAQGGYDQFYGSVQLRPQAGTALGSSASSVLSFAGELRNAPDYRFNFGGTDKSAYLEGFGFVDDTPFGGLSLRARADLNATGFSTGGLFFTRELGFEWRTDAFGGTFLRGEYRWLKPIPDVLEQLRFGATATFSDTPGHLDLDSVWLSGDPVELRLGVSTGSDTQFRIGARAGVTYREVFGGPFTVALDVSTTDVRFYNRYNANLKVSYASFDGWLITLEVVTPITNPSTATVRLGLSDWFFVPVDPPAPDVRILAQDETPTAFTPGACR